MDGRPQRKVADYVANSFGVRNLDTITTAGLVRHLATETAQTPILLDNLDLSVTTHGSKQIAVVAHHDCAGNQASDREQKEQVFTAVSRVAEMYPDLEVVGLWLDRHWIVERVRGR